MKQLFILFIFISSYSTFAQNSVDFHVSNDKGESLIGASVLQKGTSNGGVTDVDGNYQFQNIPDGEIEFIISYVGHEDEEIILAFPQSNGKKIPVVLEQGEELEEVVVSATRSSRTIEEVPTRIEAITAEELTEKAAMNSGNISMLLRESSGVQMQQTSLSSGNMSIRIQGLDGRYTQILRDGLPIYGGFAAGLSIMQIPPLDLKQVELIKGGNSTLYGGGAIAGIVNLVTKTPEEDPELTLMIDQSSALGTTGNLFYSQKFNKFGLSFYGSGNNQVQYDPDNDGFSNMPKSQTLTINPRLFYYPNSNTELSLGVGATWDDRLGGDMKVIEGNPSAENLFTEQNVSERYNSQFLFSNKSEQRDIIIKNSISYFNRKLTIPDYLFDGAQLSSFSEAFFNLHVKENTEWQFGLNYYYESFTEIVPDTVSPRDYLYNTVGGFVQNTTDIGEKFVLESGLRTDYNFEYGAFVLPRIALLYKPNQKFTSRIGGALGYKLPTIFTEDAERIYFKGIQPITTSSVNPETSIGGNIDFNYVTVIADKFTFSINQLFFITDLKNALVLREDDNTSTYFYENADGSILSSGFETNIKLGYRDFTLYLNYAFTNADLKYDNINNQKPLTPRNSAGIVLFYELEDNWSVGYEAYYTGSQFDNDFDLKPDYWMMGVMVMKHFEKVSLFVNFENFTNTIQTNFEPLVNEPYSNPTFNDIWTSTAGFVVNGGVKVKLF